MNVCRHGSCFGIGLRGWVALISQRSFPGKPGGTFDLSSSGMDTIDCHVDIIGAGFNLVSHDFGQRVTEPTQLISETVLEFIESGAQRSYFVGKSLDGIR